MVEAPGACAAGRGCHKLRTVPCAALQRRPARAGASAGGSAGACVMRAPGASPMEGTAPLLWGPPGPAMRDGHPRRTPVRPDVSLAVGPRDAAGPAQPRPGASELGGRAGEHFGGASVGGCAL
jgi:hypothetical protein